MILENIHNLSIGLLKVKIGDVVYLDDASIVGQIKVYIVLFVGELNKSTNCVTYRFYDICSNLVHIFYLDPNKPWFILKWIITQ